MSEPVKTVKTVKTVTPEVGPSRLPGYASQPDLDRLVSGRHHDPHAVRGAHALPAAGPAELAARCRG